MLRNKTIWPAALLALFVLMLLPSVSAQLTLSATEAQAGDTIVLSGDVYALTCSNGNGYLRMFLKEPSGRYSTDVSYSYEHTGGFSWPNLADIRFSVNGNIEIDESWPNGEYELVADSIYTCTDIWQTGSGNWLSSIRRGDVIESIKFRVTGNSGPEDSAWQIGSNIIIPPVSRGGAFTKTFNMDTIQQTSLKVSAHQSAACYVNGQQIASGITSQRTVDITPYLNAGQNTVRCDVSAGYEKVCRLHEGRECGCQCNNRWSVCMSSVKHWDCPSNVIQGLHWRDHNFYVMATPYFDASVSTHRLTDILWSNDNSNWYYGKLPLQSDSWWLEKPNHYNSDETIYTGIHPWSNSQLHLRKWFFKEDPGEDRQWLDFSFTSMPECTINGEVVEFLETVDDWWLYSVEVTSMPNELELVCTSPKNDIFDVFDVRFVQEVPIVSPTVAAGTPFQFSTGSSDDDPSATGWISHSVGGLAGAASSIPAAPLAGSIAAVGVLGLVRYKTGRKQKVPGKSDAVSRYWAKISDMGQKYKERLASIKKNNEDWLTLKEELRQKELKEREAEEKRKAQMFLSGLAGTAAERANKITAALRSGVFRSSQTIRTLNNATNHYNTTAINETRTELHNTTNNAIVNTTTEDESTGEKVWNAITGAYETVKGSVIWGIAAWETIRGHKIIENAIDMKDVVVSKPFHQFVLNEKRIEKNQEKCNTIVYKDEREECKEDALNHERARLWRKRAGGMVRDFAYIQQQNLAIIAKEAGMLSATEIITGASVVGGVLFLGSLSVIEAPITIGGGIAMNMVGVGYMPVGFNSVGDSGKMTLTADMQSVDNTWSYGMSYEIN